MNTGSRIQELVNNLKMKNSRNKNHAKFFESTVISLVPNRPGVIAIVIEMNYIFKVMESNL